MSLEAQIRDELSRRADDVTGDVSELVTGAIHRGRRNRRRRHVALVGAAVVVVALSPLVAPAFEDHATVYQAPSGPAAAPPTAPPTDPTLITSPNPSNGSANQAIVTGILRVNAAGCFALDDAVLLAPYGSTVEGRTVNLAGIGRFRVGERVTAGGGYADDLSRTNWPEPMTCVPTGKTPNFAIPQEKLTRTRARADGTPIEVTPCSYLAAPPKDGPQAGGYEAPTLLRIQWKGQNVVIDTTDPSCLSRPAFRKLIEDSSKTPLRPAE